MMNCRRFQAELYEYVEGTLSAGEQASARRHLEDCAACREAVENELKLANNLSARLLDETASLRLSPEARRNILAAGRQTKRPGIFESVEMLWVRFATPSALALSFLVAAVLVTIHLSGIQRTHARSAPAGHGDAPPSVSIRISSRVPILKSYRQGSSVIDTLSYETVVASGRM